MHEWKKKSVEHLQELNEDLVSFTGVGNETNVKELMNQIEAEMSKATTSKGKARFADFKGASDNSNLAKLMEYNEEKQNVEMEKAKDARDGVKNTSDNLDESTVKEYADDEFISYLQDRGLLEDYLTDHKIVAEQEEIKKLDEEIQGYVNRIEEAYIDGDINKAAYQELRLVAINDGTEKNSKPPS